MKTLHSCQCSCQCSPPWGQRENNVQLRSLCKKVIFLLRVACGVFSVPFLNWIRSFQCPHNILLKLNFIHPIPCWGKLRFFPVFCNRPVQVQYPHTNIFLHKQEYSWRLFLSLQEFLIDLYMGMWSLKIVFNCSFICIAWKYNQISYCFCQICFYIVHFYR